MKYVTVKISDKEHQFPAETTLEEINFAVQEKVEAQKQLAAICNNNLRPLRYAVTEDCTVKFLDYSDKDGVRIYMISLTFLFIRSVREVIKDSRVSVKHSFNSGIFFEIKSEEKIDETVVKSIKQKMQELIKEDVSFIRTECKKEELYKLLAESSSSNEYTKILLYKNSEYAHIYSCGWMNDYYYGYMVPSTRYLSVFDVKLYQKGIVLIGPSNKNHNKVAVFKPQPKLFQVYNQAQKWGKILNTHNVFELNKKIETDEYHEVIQIAEAAHEKKICEIADMIRADKEKGRIILISGPSSSGKTSFANRLMIQLKVNGLRPYTISTDNYFLDRKDTPRDENGNYDFETIDAIDVEMFNKHMQKIIAGEEVTLPTFDFIKGEKYYKTENTIRLKEDQPLIIEGIHGLNPVLSANIPDGNKFKIYVSPLVQLNLDNHNRISTSDLRMIRRIARDTRTRGKKIQDVISAFDALRIGEEKYIFPYQENADVMFNSALIYELSVLKKYVYPMLIAVSYKDAIYREAKRLAKFLQFFLDIDDEKDISPTSILREFIGGTTLFQE